MRLRCTVIVRKGVSPNPKRTKWKSNSNLIQLQCHAEVGYLPTSNNAFGHSVRESKNKEGCGPLLTTAREKTVSNLISYPHSRKVNNSNFILLFSHSQQFPPDEMLLVLFLTRKKSQRSPHFIKDKCRSMTFN